MKLLPAIRDIWQSGNYAGPNRAQTRVTVEPDWQLHKTDDVFGKSERGPYRWWQREANDQNEIEIPNIKTVTIDRGIDNDVATMTLEVYNTWHARTPKVGQEDWFDVTYDDTTWDNAPSIQSWDGLGHPSGESAGIPYWVEYPRSVSISDRLVPVVDYGSLEPWVLTTIEDGSMGTIPSGTLVDLVTQNGAFPGSGSWHLTDFGSGGHAAASLDFGTVSPIAPGSKIEFVLETETSGSGDPTNFDITIVLFSPASGLGVDFIAATSFDQSSNGGSFNTDGGTFTLDVDAGHPGTSDSIISSVNVGGGPLTAFLIIDCGDSHRPWVKSISMNVKEAGVVAGMTHSGSAWPFWIWGTHTSTIGVTPHVHQEGTCYFRKKFTTSSELDLRFEWAVDNEGVLFLDGKPIDAHGNDGLQWQQNHIVEIQNLPAGDHVIAIRATNYNSPIAGQATPGGVILVACIAGTNTRLDDGYGGYVSTDSEWKTYAYPTLGQIPFRDSPEVLAQYGKPGWLWADRGGTPEAFALWKQQVATGAYDKHGNYLQDFSWRNVIVPNALLRTYQGYGNYASGYTALSYDDDSWDYAYEHGVWGTTPWNYLGTNYPTDFTDTTANWIWSAAPVDGSNPAGYAYARKRFNVPSDTRLRIEWTIDNSGVVSYDGTPIDSTDPSPTGWQTNNTVIQDVTAGGHVLAFKAWNDAGPGGILCAVYSGVAEDGSGGTLLFHSDSSWKTLGYPRGESTALNPLPISFGISSKNLTQTGVWLIDTVTAGTNGILSIKCRDIGRLLLDQQTYPPLIPEGLYPLEYYPPGQSAYDNSFDPQILAAAGYDGAPDVGPVRLVYVDKGGSDWSSSVDELHSEFNHSIDGHVASHTVDYNDSYGYAISDGYASPDQSDAVAWWEYDVGAEGGHFPIRQIGILPWQGNYVCYISIMKEGESTWTTGDLDGGTIPTSNTAWAIPYVTSVRLPRHKSTVIDLPGMFDAKRVRVTLRHFAHTPSSTTDPTPYRAGLMEVRAYTWADANVYVSGGAAIPVSATADRTPWTFAMARHPTRGYWVVDKSGNVYGYGDAADFVEDILPGSGCVGMVAALDGKGYWVLESDGTVHAKGSAAGILAENAHNIPGVPGAQYKDIALTNTGQGYWLIRDDGTISCHGDAPMYDTNNLKNETGYHWGFTIPETAAMKFMESSFYDANGKGGPLFVPGRYRATCGVGHPTQKGLWISNGNGEVFACGAAYVDDSPHHNYGQLEERVYSPVVVTGEGTGKAKVVPPASDSFKLTCGAVGDPVWGAGAEWPHGMDCTPDGKGYWLCFGSGHIAAFGNARNIGSTYIYEGLSMPTDDLANAQLGQTDYSFFRALVWDLVRDPSGQYGFYVLAADGSVGVIGRDGRLYPAGGPNHWNPGNYSDWSDIVKELLLWSGFLLYPNSIDPNSKAPVYAGIETTGFTPDSELPSDFLNKMPVMDAIHKIKEISGYIFYINDEGRPEYRSPNWWQSGNLNAETGVWQHIDALGLTVDTQLAYYNSLTPEERYYLATHPEDPNYCPPIEILTIDESETLIDYSVTLNSDSLRSEIIVSSNEPDWKNDGGYTVTHYHPPNSTLATLRGIERLAMWTNQAFKDPVEQLLMSELIALHIWFSQRQGSVTFVANPEIQINDQIKIVERNTAEVYNHYVRGLSSNFDADTGVWKMTATTNWLGTKDNWVIRNNQTGNPLDPFGSIEVSNHVYDWYSFTKRGTGLSPSQSRKSFSAELTWVWEG